MNPSRTALYQQHVSAGAKMVPFAGWEMPILYTGIVEEHRRVRTRAGIFDVSHMGDLVISGDGAKDLLERTLTNDISLAREGKGIYSHILDHDGHIIDDTIVYNLGDSFLMVPNASTKDKVLEWMRAQAEDAAVLDLSSELSCIALQGPCAEEVMRPLVDLSELKRFHILQVPLPLPDSTLPSPFPALDGMNCLIARTGYTGEDGFEIIVSNDAAPALWNRLLEDERVSPVGLGARDTLRLEKGMLLSGTDFDGSQTSLQTGPHWVVKFDHDFIGREALEAQSRNGDFPVLAGMVMDQKGIPRHGYAVLSSGEEVGVVTSGTMSPMLEKGIALAYLPQSLSAAGTELDIVIRDRPHPATVTRLPFL